MITNIEKQIKIRLEKEYKLFNKKLSFLKYNTPISGTGLGNKVIFFVFVENQEDPQFIVKTVRTYRDANAIKSGYNNLKNLNKMTIDSKFSDMFPNALFLYDIDNEIWNIETVCIGRRPSVKSNVDLILQKFIDFSKHVSTQQKDRIVLKSSYGKDLINGFQCSKKIIEGLIVYLEQLWGNKEIELPSIPQHGDFTLDNILINRKRIKIIDCDTFGNIKIPGFDIFHFLSRNSIQNKKRWLEKYFKQIGISYIPDKRLLFIYFLHELYIKRDYILVNEEVSSIIEKFENMIVSYL